MKVNVKRKTNLVGVHDTCPGGVYYSVRMGKHLLRLEATYEFVELSTGRIQKIDHDLQEVYAEVVVSK